MERSIASGTATAQTWQAYGQRLSETGDFARAAMAYEKVIDAEPYNRPARVQRGLALARAGEASSLMMYLRSQLHQEPKLVVELLDRPELRSFLGDTSFAALATEARAQAMD